jgi:hypothetical protein
MEVSGQLHAPAALPRETAPGTHWIGGWVGPQGRSGRGGEEKISLNLRGIKQPAHSPVTVLTKLSQLYDHGAARKYVKTSELLI